MRESGGDGREKRDEMSLLIEELIQLSVKRSKVVPSGKPTLICTIWTEKLYNPKIRRRFGVDYRWKTMAVPEKSEISGEWCRLKINLNVQKPLRRDIFVSMDNMNKWWISFKYEKLPMFCFGCGKVGHYLSDCNELNPVRAQCSYTGGFEVEVIKDKITREVNSLKGMMHGRLQLSGEEKMMKK
ncbi:hypothetical protein Goshw_023966 [Gossypium schwendimanii]|uniref:CCHC-type domain-containing protein n=1 Tax=Gossypium schwendimanii TaxID=34291 RepID=A0A7J9MPX4_GOSSC|nr:hypothetical protein [Gossypium schwendimanii]